MMKKKTQVEGTEIDLLDGLMQVKDEEGNRISDREVVDNIVSLVIGGFESTTLSIMWAIYYLAKYPKVLEKLRVGKLLSQFRKIIRCQSLEDR